MLLKLIVDNKTIDKVYLPMETIRNFKHRVNTNRRILDLHILKLKQNNYLQIEECGIWRIVMCSHRMNKKSIKQSNEQGDIRIPEAAEDATHK
jgi:hypothetical protein